MRYLIIYFLLTSFSAGFSQMFTVTPNTTQEEATIDSLQLNVYLWRDFQPIAPPKGKPMRVKIEIIPHRTALLQQIQIESVRLIHERDTVEIAGEEIQPLLEILPDRLRFVWRKGPYWPPKSTVDVEVMIRLPENKQVILKAEHQPIHATF